ncbi:MAG TPA: PEP/pyruvate-binding domain-containing protein, partial [Pyrinomonadaceae bacterium]|nr:PEP/pyruvate-binding domain-containing protein [Pyrinomonadaceae bacterium]
AQPGTKPSPARASRADLRQRATTGKNSLPIIKTQAEFDSLSRVYHQKTPYALPHLMFVLDRKDKNKIYYINSKKYLFHRDFINGTYLSLKRGDDFFKDIYVNDKRRFIVGTLAWQTPVKSWTFEFWEGDTIPADLIKLTYERINGTFFAPVAFKPNSIPQDESTAKIAGMKRILPAEINKEQEYMAMNTAKGVGRIHVIDKLDDSVEIGYNEILVLKEVPISLPPVAGIIMAQPSTPLSHINLLARGWGVPTAYIKNADKLFKDLDTYWVEFETKLDRYSIKRADKKTMDDWQRAEEARGKVTRAPKSNLNVTRLASLSEQRKTDSIAYGAKSANLGEIWNARLPNIVVPNGFAVSFAHYKNFMESNGFMDEIADLMFDLDFVHNPKIRRQKLAEFRQKLQNGKFDEKLKDEIIRKWQTELGGKGVFVRSSSNAEDLPNFSGAGLYDTVPNVKEADKLIEAVKTVWASIWKFEAYEARERGFVDHTQTYMGVLIQEGVNSESSGVMITRDPYNPYDKNSIYISAKRGLGIKVVEGKRVAEQILFAPKSNSVQVLTRSDEDSLLVFDEKGGVKDVPISGERAVLTDKTVRDLSKTAAQIKRIFGGKIEQDIEWGYVKGQIYIFQSRPFVQN